jgi:hypothetical protein
MIEADVTYNKDGIDIELHVTAEYIAAERGYRNRYGVPEEPDSPSYLEDLKAVVRTQFEDAGGNIIPVGFVLDLSEKDEEEITDLIWTALATDEP